MDQFTKLRKEMVEIQLKKRGIKDLRVLEAFYKVPRHLFVNDINRNNAYNDYPLSIGCSQTISQPYMVALMTQCLELGGYERILEIGTGSGYQTAILAELVDEVYSIERHTELGSEAKKQLEKLNYKNIVIKIDDGTLGWKDFMPYDGIIVTAGAPSVPTVIVEQLSTGGRLVIPVGDKYSQKLKVVKKEEEGVTSEDICSCMFVSLIGEYGWNR